MSALSEMVVIGIHHVRSYEESQKIGSEVMMGETALVELGKLENVQKQRMLDFLSGVSYVKGSMIIKVAEDVYLITSQKCEAKE